MNCPKCVGKLEKKSFKSGDHDLVIDQCFSCQGIWFDKDELNKLGEFDLTKLDLDSNLDNYNIYKLLDEKAGVCPRCNIEMKKTETRFDDNKKENPEGKWILKMDVCSQCEGIWLDGNEVKYFVDISATAVENSGPEQKPGGMLSLINRARSALSRIINRRGK